MTGETTGAFELFYSYAHNDERLRNELNKHLHNLKRQGLITDWYDRDISAGTEWEKEIDSHLNSAQVILLLISPDFMASDYCYSIEMKRALERHELGEARVIPILLKVVDWKDTPFSKLQALPKNAKAVTSWKDRNAAFFEIAKGIREALKELQSISSNKSNLSSINTQATTTSQDASQSLEAMIEEIRQQQAELAPVWTVPYPRNALFTGREPILQHLRETFSKKPDGSPKLPVILSGLGGIGKTQIAIEYAYRYREAYHVVLWAQADSQEILTTKLASFAPLLNVTGQHEQDQQYALAAVKRWLEVFPKWLLILDNVEDLKTTLESLPIAPLGDILLTMRSQVTGGVTQRIDIDKLEPDEATLFLLHRVHLLDADAPLDHASEEQYIQAREIVTMLGGLPLAIDQAGAYIEENGARMSRYRELFTTRRTDLLNRRGGIRADHPESIATTFSLSFEKVAQTNEAALELLYCMAFLHPDAIPDDLLERGASQLGSLLEAVVTDPFEFDQAIGHLRNYSLVRRNPDGATLSIHRLVQDILKDGMDEPTQRQWAERIVRATDQAFPRVEFATWETCQRYLPHAQVCSGLIESWHLVFPEAARLLYETGRYLNERGQYTEAAALIAHSLSIREQTLGTEHLEVAESLNELGELDKKQANYTQGEPLVKRALAIREKMLGPNNPDVATSLNSLALLYLEQGRYSKAEPLLKRALAIREQVLGPTHPDTAISLNDLATIYSDQRRYSEAEPLLKRALVIREQVLGPTHPDTAISLTNLGTLYSDQRRYSEAEPLEKRALAIWEQELGPIHPNTAHILSNLGIVYDGQGRYSEAEQLEKRALAIREQTLGPTHPATAISLTNVATLYRDQRRYSEAEPLYKRALDIHEQIFGYEHPDVLIILGNYVMLLLATNRKGRAAEMEAQLNILRKHMKRTGRLMREH